MTNAVRGLGTIKPPSAKDGACKYVVVLPLLIQSRLPQRGMQPNALNDIDDMMHAWAT